MLGIEPGAAGSGSNCANLTIVPKFKPSYKLSFLFSADGTGRGPVFAHAGLPARALPGWRPPLVRLRRRSFFLLCNNPR